LLTQGQVSPFRAGSPHYVEFHGDRIIKTSFARVFSNPVEGVTTETPKVKNPPAKGGKGVISITLLALH